MDERTHRRHGKMPLVEQDFHPGSGEPFGRARFGGEPSRKISLLWLSEYLRRELHREFFFEGIAFGVIVLMAAWPLASLVMLLMRVIN
jgi:hypothetical protein